MKKIVLFLAAALLVGTALTSCKDKKAPADTKPVETSMFTKEDTAKVMDLVNQFTICLQNGDIKGAVDMLVYLEGDSIKPQTPANLQRQAVTLSFIAGKPGYELERIILNNTTNNEAKINVVLFEKKDENDKRPNTTAIYVRPVFIDGQWHLTPRDNITESVKDDPVEEAVERKAAAEELANEED
ncbi:MAG: hypothetical protein II429_00340 [Prevotella sp.]|nr:hypothetical protein [Prevotella sp.]